MNEEALKLYAELTQAVSLCQDEDIKALGKGVLVLANNYDKSLKEIERLNNKYNKALELLADYNLPCEYDEGKIPDNYCEENCSEDYKKCWNKYIELELKGDSSNE